jgi:hypothetical protein
MARTHTNTQLREYGWLIETEDEPIHADGLSSTVPSVPKGETGSWEFRFRTDRYVGETTADPSEHLYQYEQLLEYADHAGRFVVERRATENVARYREQHSEESLLVRIAPASDSTTTSGIWGLIAGVDDQSLLPEELAIVDLSIVLLADGEEFETHAEVRRDLESRGP